jgi:uncharacterized membrane protein YjfL (UPF0719 family)
LHRESYQINRAVSIFSSGYYIAFILIVLVSLNGVSINLVDDLIAILTVGSIGILLISTNRFLLKYIFLYEVNYQHELDRENNSFALFHAGSLIATATLFYYSFSQFQLTVEFLTTALFYFIIAQFTLFAVVKIITLFSGYDYLYEIRKNNLASGIEFLSIFIAVSLLLGNSIEVLPDISINSVASIFIYFIISLSILIYIPNLLVSLMVFGNKKIYKSISDGNVMISIKSGIIKVILAFLVVESLPLNFVSS